MTFPALVPIKRPVVLPKYQNGGPLEAASGKEIRVLLSNAVDGPEFQMNFVLTDEADFLSIRNHFEQVGIAGRFDVDAQTIGVNGIGAVPTVAGHQYHYVEPPEWEETCEAWFVRVVLSRAPAASATYGGGYFTWTSKFTAAPVTGMTYPGARVLFRGSFTPGPVTGMSYAGAQVVWTEQFTPGAFG